MICLTLFFDDPFWVGHLERLRDGRLEVCLLYTSLGGYLHLDLGRLLKGRHLGHRLGVHLLAHEVHAERHRHGGFHTGDLLQFFHGALKLLLGRQGFAARQGQRAQQRLSLIHI